MNEIAEVVARAIPPLFFHYIIVVFVVGLILCVCVLKFKYLYWYEQPLTFRFTVQRFFRGGGGGGVGRHPTSIMNPLSLGTRCYNAVVYPFLHHVNHDTVRVYRGNDEDSPPPFERISHLLQQQGTNNGGGSGGGIVHKNAGLIACDSSDTLRLLLSQDTFGLSAFIGVFVDKAMTATATASDRSIKGVSVLTPRIMISFDSSIATSSYRSVSIYMSEYLAWNKYTMIERESLELVETTEYIQKSREIAGEQTLYRYSEIPWFVIPFSTVYSYVFTPPPPSAPPQSIQNSIIRSGITIVHVSSANFALFYSFVNESTRDFRCCILNELTQLQSLVDHKLYRIYMLVLNEVRVIAVYVFTRSAMPRRLLNDSTTRDRLLKTAAPNKKKRTKGNRISDLHDHVSKTSTALVKYLPPVLPPRYDAFGKRISSVPPNTKTHEMDPTAPFPSSSASGHTVIRLISSIQHKSLCEASDFLTGFQRVCSIEMSKNGKSGYGAVMIDTIAHNYRIIDHLVAKESLSWPLISQDKWYYILYNAIIHEETLCKDILMV